MTATSPYINDDLVNVFYTVDRTGLLSDDWYSAWVPGIVDPPSWYPFKIEGMRRIRSGPLAFLLLLLRTLQPIIDAETVPYCTIVDNADLERARELLALKWTPNPAIEILLSRVRSAMEKAEGVTHENYGLWARDEEVVLVNLLRKIFEISYRPTCAFFQLQKSSEGSQLTPFASLSLLAPSRGAGTRGRPQAQRRSLCSSAR